MKKAVINYAGDPDSELATLSDNVYEHMNGNDNFPDPEPTMPTYLAAKDNYKVALAAASDRSRSAVAAKNAIRTTLVDMLRNLAMYVNTVCKGDEVKLLSSGLRMCKTPGPAYLTEPVITSVKQSLNPGCVTAKVGSSGARSLLYKIAADPITPATEWMTFGSSRSQYEFTGLEQGKKYWIQVVAIGSNNQQAFSEEVAVFVAQRSMIP